MVSALFTYNSMEGTRAACSLSERRLSKQQGYVSIVFSFLCLIFETPSYYTESERASNLQPSCISLPGAEVTMLSIVIVF